jgi:glycine/D-amino acid oxidase-like deaminating enzyme
MKTGLVWLGVLLALPPAGAAEPAAAWDVCVYGGTSAGVAAAVQAARLGKSVVLIEPGRHLGGMTSGGLGATDFGKKPAIGGLAREFYRRVARHYAGDAAWRFERRRDYRSHGHDPAEDAMWYFEPHVAEAIFDDLVRESGVRVVFGERLDLEHGVRKEGPRIASIAMESGRIFRARVFIDAGYEGDLMARAGVPYRVGRESGADHGEWLAGVQAQHLLYSAHNFHRPVDPYVVPGDPSSGLLPGVTPGGPGAEGAGDRRVQAYCFRLCMTEVPENRVEFPRPEGYDPARYELLLRHLTADGLFPDNPKPLPVEHPALGRDPYIKIMPNRKTDSNTKGALSSNLVGAGYDYPDGDYATRERIIKDHETYQKGLLWFLAHDPRVPEKYRRPMATWGLAKDEFADNGHWPHQLYVREARRMIGAYVLTQHDCDGRRRAEDPVGLGSYTMDSHTTQRYVDSGGSVRNEGTLGGKVPRPYPISYRAIVPRAEDCTNLLVPVCCSASHVGYGSLRMEPVFMILGQSAGTAACLAIDGDRDVQRVPYAALRARLAADGQVLAWGDDRPGAAAADANADADADVIIYGGTSSGVIASVQAARMGKRTVLIVPDGHLGGMTTGGLGATDRGSPRTVTGLAREFYRRLYAFYGDPSAWKYETRAEYLPRHPWTTTEDLKLHWFFEPHAADRVYRDMLAQAGVTIVSGERLDLKAGVEKDGVRIVAIIMEGGRRFTGKAFLDATYEGDLMARAGVTYVVGREPNSRYDEEFNGIQLNRPIEGVDPFVVPGSPSSGTLPGVGFPHPPGAHGQGDGLTQAYNFRLTLTDVKENQVAIARPDDYDPRLYELLARQLAFAKPTVIDKVLLRLTPMPNHKTDTNNSGLFSTDFLGMSYDWPEADHATRARIWQAHKSYTLGLLWFLGHDERVPRVIRDEMLRWGLAKDEFPASGHWTPQLYVREARRMVSDAVVTDRDARHLRKADDVVALATYAMDSHYVSRYVDPQGALWLEGGYGMSLKAKPMPVGYRSIVPRRGEASNLVVPVCLSASHAAYGSIRMEPVFMMLGQSAATAACLAIDAGVPLQDLPYPVLRARLLADGLVLE